MKTIVGGGVPAGLVAFCGAGGGFVATLPGWVVPTAGTAGVTPGVAITLPGAALIRPPGVGVAFGLAMVET